MKSVPDRVGDEREGFYIGICMCTAHATEQNTQSFMEAGLTVLTTGPMSSGVENLQTAK